jgi:multimeric flavodoxin WrbA/quercetin dioxygenase-like cupin family protein
MSVPKLRTKVLLRSEETDGQVSMIDNIVPAGAKGPFLHRHDCDEALYMLEGELVFQVRDELIAARAGDLAFAPRNVPHTFTNRSDRPARYVLVCTPAGFERYFARMAAEQLGGSRPSGRCSRPPRWSAWARGSASGCNARPPLWTEESMNYSDLRALFINCTLKRSPEVSNTEGLADLAMTIMRRTGVEVELIRAVDHEIATGVWPDMTEHGWERDDWPAIFEKVIAADILVLLTPIWLGEKSSVCTQVIERLYGNSHLLNDDGQYAYYGRAGGCLVTGNEDGIKHCAMNVLYSLQHLGYAIPPQADAGWIGEAGPGPSYLDEGSGGLENDFTNRNTTFMTWNLLHMARMLKDRGGIPAHGNQRSEWDAGCRFDYPNPEHR